VKLLIKVIRGVPASAMIAVWVAILIAGLMGGIHRVGAWVLGLQLAVPAFGLLSLLWVIVTCAIRRRIDPLERFSLAMAVSGLAMLTFTFQVMPVPYPAGDGEPVAMVRPPMDGPIIVGWGGDAVSTNYHAKHPDQRWAYDLLIAPGFVGTENNADFGCWGQPVFAPIGGTVVIAEDESPDQDPGIPDPTVHNPCGNEIAIQMPTDTFLIICHLQSGSISVAPGDVVTEGQPIGRCGNSGHTSEPHVHIHHQRQDPTLYPFGFAEGLRLGFSGVEGPAFPRGGIEVDGNTARAVGDVIRFGG
jgi:hypothetical protein